MMNEKFLTVDQLAELLQVKRSWIYGLTMRGQEGIPHRKFGKYLRFDLLEVVQHFEPKERLPGLEQQGERN